MEDKEVGKYCSKAKRMWTTVKTERVKIDELNKLEAAKVGTDIELAEMVAQKEDLEKQIVTRIDETVLVDRDPLYIHNDPINLLKKCLHELHAIHGLYATGNKNADMSEHFQLNNTKLIKEIEQVI